MKRAKFRKIKLFSLCWYGCGGGSRGLLTFRDFSEIPSCVSCALTHGKAKIRKPRHTFKKPKVYEGNISQVGIIGFGNSEKGEVLNQ
jgi:hypothetical protein